MRGKFHVLVVDDDPDKTELLKLALSLEGYEVHTATNGREALSAIESFQPDLIVSDIMMPEVNGYELARRIRENPRTRYIPIILQSAARIEAKDFRLGEEVGALGFITDTSDLDLLLARSRTLLDFRAHLETCEEAAFTDHLTGAANRRRFDQQLEREIERAERYGHPFCLLLLDIDDFKKINDTFGHETGDEVINHLAKILHDGIRAPDLVARIGGDEFAVLLVETNVIKGFEVADRLRQTIKDSDFPTAGSAGSGSLKITASFGIAELPPDEPTTPELLARRADAALYEAKREGRDRVNTAQPLRRARASGH
ncbi:MAG TPA: diguanylate cyclase [Pyrinomonadaceae bacterium]|nr:diguanylate cyclase [Pyrinomonadaceae bacterium]